jgi:nitroreductase
MFLDILRQRRSIRTSVKKPVEREKIDQLIEAALRAPSSRGLNPWQFILVSDKDLLTALARAKPHGASFLASAPLGIVVCADSNRSDVWIEDAAIASTLIHLAAVSLELGSCWIQIRKRMHDPSKTAQAYVRDVLDVPDSLAVESIIAVGYPDEIKPGHPKKDLPDGKVHNNRYGEPLT